MKHPLAPPGETTRIHASRVLVLAPHADDEVLGCGGLLALLVEDGAEVQVLYLSDSSGGDEVTDDREAYALTRSEEAARGLALLGITASRGLDLPDGALDEHLDRAAKGIASALVELRPDLLLCVSPLETTRDHQAAFAALHRVLSPLRGGSDLDRVAAELQILLYEINHPLYPNLLVDVSSQQERLSEAISEHRSQLELHNYLEGALGMRRYRTLSLPAEVTAAEAYCRLTPHDFATSGLADLIHRLGGRAHLHQVHEGPLVSVVVRTRDRQELLTQALASVAASTYRRVEVVLVNDGGQPPAMAEDFPFPVRRVNLATNLGRAGAANAGLEAATGEYVSFLDDDDLMAPEHLSTLIGLVGAAGVRVAYTDAAVVVYHLDGEEGWREAERRLPYSRDFDPELLLFDNYIPFNTLIIERELLTEAGPFDQELPFFEDWELLIRLARLSPFHHLAQVTCEYRQFRGGGHHVLGDQPHERADFLQMKASVIERYATMHNPTLLARVIDRLREETVQMTEARDASLCELNAAAGRYAELLDTYHRLNGERASMAAERDQVLAERSAMQQELDGRRAETRILHELESELRNKVEEQEEHLARLYAEIERLNRVTIEMQGTRVWKLHRFFDRLRGR